MTSDADRQRAYRNRRDARTERMAVALTRIGHLLDGNDRPLALRIRDEVEKGLGSC